MRVPDPRPLSSIDPATVDHILDWKPHAKERPRTIITANGYRTYTAHATRKAEAALAEQWTLPPLSGPINVTLVFSDTEVGVNIVPAPPPLSRRLRGDTDNYAKLVMDALNGLAWLDDSQIVSLTVKKV